MSTNYKRVVVLKFETPAAAERFLDTTFQDRPKRYGYQVAATAVDLIGYILVGGKLLPPPLCGGNRDAHRNH
jgi:hypothetical protein